MARYRVKSREERVWNAIRRAATARRRLEAAAWLEERLNEDLPALQTEFLRMLNSGKLPELESECERWVEDALKAAGTPALGGGAE